MSRKPETTAANRVNTRVKDCYFEKMHNPYRGGTPDFYYEGSAKSMWIEYKWYEKKPTQWSLTSGKDPKITVLQQNWLRRAHSNRQLTAVIVAYERLYAIFPGDSWETEFASHEDLTAQETAMWIEFNVT